MLPDNNISVKQKKPIQYALDYVVRGWPVFPCKPGDKRPLTHNGFKDASLDPAVIKTWWNTHPQAEVGVATGEGLLVVDLDPRGEKGDGLEQWAALVEQHGGAPETLTATTPSGGRHLYFKVDRETRNTAGKLAPQIDTRGNGGYVVAPSGSDSRVWLKPDCEVAQSPVWLVDLITAKPAPDPAPVAPAEPSGCDAVTRARAYVAKIPPAVSGEGGHDQTFHVAMVLVEGFALSREDALALLREYNGRCLPPWSERELQHKIDSALERVNPAQRGHLLREGSSATPSTVTAPGAGGTDFFLLPGGSVTITRAAELLFNRLSSSGDFFLHGGQVVRRADSGLEPVLPEELRSIPETVFDRVVAERAGRDGDVVLVPRTMPVDSAKAVLACDARRVLPEVKIVVSSPVVLPDGRTLSGGLDRDTGILVEGNDSLPEVPLDEAVLLLADLLEDFHFLCPGDAARAMAAILTPALRMGGFLRLCPLLVVEADQSQTGKTFFLKLIFALYGESPRTIAQRNGGVGSFDESLASALLAGRPFITFDNLRGKVDSQYLEAALTDESAIDVRVPHKGSVPVDPSRFVLSATSNAASMTKDLANRSYFVRLQRQPDGYQFQHFPEGDLLDHVRLNRGKYLGAIHAVLRRWIFDGSKTTTTTEHDFRQWARTLEHIIGEYFFQSVDFFQGMREAKARVSDPSGGFIRELALLAFQAGGRGREWTAADLAELAEDNAVTLANGKTPDCRNLARMLGRMFGDGDRAEIENLTIERAVHEGTRSNGQPFTQKVYKFSG